MRMDPSAPVLVLLHRVGPYHHARFQAAAKALQSPLLVLQTRPNSQEYPWSFSVEGSAYTLLSLSGGLEPEQDPPTPLLRKQLSALIDEHQPAVIVSVGWADPAYLSLLALSQQRKIPLVVVSDSCREDSHRSSLKEWLKRQLLRGYSSALVAGSRSRNYIVQLGIEPEAIHQPWDVVDNRLIAQLAAQAESAAPPADERPFLCVGRLIPEKNHALLLQAFTHYQLQGGTRNLLLVGHGPLEEAIRSECVKLPRPDSVKLIPFVELEQLACYYGQAHALVLPSRKDTWGLVVNEAMAAELPAIVSSACGCVDDLIEHGVTGWRFSSDNAPDLAQCLYEVDVQPLDERQRMTSMARSRLDEFGPESFANGLKNACMNAISRPKYSFRSQLLAHLLQVAD